MFTAIGALVAFVIFIITKIGNPADVLNLHGWSICAISVGILADYFSSKR